MNNVQEILHLALMEFGAASQLDKTCEECAELIDALLKYKQGRATTKEVATELADVMIMVQQMIYLFDRQEYVDEYTAKVIRLEKLIKQHKEDGTKLCD